MFKIVSGNHHAPVMRGSLRKGTFEIVSLDRQIIRAFTLGEIKSLTLIESKIASGTDAAGLGLVGALLAGPIGVAAGVGLAALARPCTFILELDKGDKYACEGPRTAYNNLVKAFNIQQISNSGSTV